MTLLLVDKHEPKGFDEVKHNPEVCQFLQSLAHSKNMPHILIQGARGIGKKLLIRLFLKEKYGVFETSPTTMQFKIQGKTEDKSVMNLLASSYHYQFNPQNHNTYDRTLLKLFLTEISYSIISKKIDYRIIIIEDADLLTIEAQEALRRTLETHISHCRFIFISNNEGRIIDPIRSRCAVIRVNSPSHDQLSEILTGIWRHETEVEAVADAPLPVPAAISSIVQQCNRNIHTAINYLERYLLDPSAFNIKECDPVMIACESIVSTIIKGSDLNCTIDKVREVIYSLVNYCVEHKVILECLLDMFMKRIPKQYHQEKYQLCLKAAERDFSLRHSSKGIYHLEGFCLFAMSIIKDIMGNQKKKKVIVKAKAKAN